MSEFVIKFFFKTATLRYPFLVYKNYVAHPYKGDDEVFWNAKTQDRKRKAREAFEASSNPDIDLSDTAKEKAVALALARAERALGDNSPSATFSRRTKQSSNAWHVIFFRAWSAHAPWVLVACEVGEVQCWVVHGSSFVNVVSITCVHARSSLHARPGPPSALVDSRSPATAALRSGIARYARLAALYASRTALGMAPLPRRRARTYAAAACRHRTR